eukprot:1123445-Ditylum_brightwellii.AAC.1
MEADAALEYTKRLYKGKPAVLGKIVTDNDSSMKAILCHLYKKKENNKELFPTYVLPRTSKGQKQRFCIVATAYPKAAVVS